GDNATNYVLSLARDAGIESFWKIPLDELAARAQAVRDKRGKEGEIVKFDFTAMDGNNQVFDTTVEKKAIEAGIFNEKRKYRPAIAIIGEHDFFPKIEEAIQNSEPGKKISLELEPKDAFGERNPEFLRMVPLKEFKEQKIMPFPGMPVEINNMQGRVQTVSGGRVRVDFNHPLAGKKVKYEIEVKEIVKEKNEKIKAFMEKYLPFLDEKDSKWSAKEGIIEIMVPEKFASGISPFKKAFAEIAMKHLEGIHTVRFIEEYSKKAKIEEAIKKHNEGTKSAAEKTAEKEEKKKK
ncbi:MAG: FKBP-type peptidyl-prolyl cis-trans isomerase, partial [Candidatus Diapherotrites archaeon]